MKAEQALLVIHMKKLIIILFFLTSLPVLAQKQGKVVSNDTRLKGLDTAFQHVLKTWHAAGFAVAVVEKNKIIYAKGFGYRNVERKLPVTPNTVFAIGSCTKAFTASLIGLLQKEGKVNLDKPVNSFMPSIRFYNDNMNNSITLRDMMSHRTGLPRHDISWAFFPTQSSDSILQRIQYQEPTAPVRQIFQYNNFMFAAQGAITEKLTGKKWEESIAEKFFIPLGMSASNTSIEEMVKGNEPATGYEAYQDSIIRKVDYDHFGGMSPAGAINSSVNDMAKWVTAWINGGRFNSKEIIPADYYRQAISSQMVVNSNLPTPKEPGLYFSNYGLGWFLSSYKGHYRVEHGGNVPGFSASTCFFPSDSIGIVVLTNQTDSGVPAVVRNLIADRLLGNQYDDWSSALRFQYAKAKAEEQDQVKAANVPHKHFLPTHPLADFTGSYFNPGYGRFKVYLRHDSLFTKTIAGSGWLRHYNYDSFDFFNKDRFYGLDTTAMPFRIQFLMNAQGNIEGVSGLYEPGLKPIVFTKEMEAIAVTPKDLQKYAGDYDLAGATIKIYTKGANTLYALVPGQPEYELVALGKDKFGIKVLTGYFAQFELDAFGKVVDYILIQPNGNYKATKR